MAIYLGSNKVALSSGEYTAWWSYKNPQFLYESNYNCSLDETNDWKTYKETHSTSARTIKFAPTTYTTTANANVVYDRWGVNNNDGEALDFTENDYFVLNDMIINMAYTTDEATMATPHPIRYARTALIPIYKKIAIVSNEIKYPPDGAVGTMISGNYQFTYGLFRNASNNLLLYDGGYGIYFNAVVPTYQNTNQNICQYINFRTPTLAVRGHNTYLTQAAFAAIDGENTWISVRQRLYKIKKECLDRQAFTRIGNMLTTGELPIEAI